MPGSIARIGIVGAGTMGAQIALLCAVHRYTVWLFSRTDQTLQRAAQSHTQTLDTRFAGRQLTTVEKDKILSCIHVTTNLAEAVEQADLVIENAPEALDTKRDLFAQLDRLCASHTVMATNTSSYPVSMIEDVTSRREQVLNLHFVTPVWDGGIVELMRGTVTSDETIARARQFVRSLNLYPFVLAKESKGLVLPRLLSTLLREARRIAEDGIASPEEVDRAWMIATNMEFGPFAVMDMIGLDVIRDSAMSRYRVTGDSADAPAKVIMDKVERGELGVKTGKGFYTYPDPAFQAPGWLRDDDYRNEH